MQDYLSSNKSINQFHCRWSCHYHTIYKFPSGSFSVRPWMYYQTDLLGPTWDWDTRQRGYWSETVFSIEAVSENWRRSFAMGPLVCDGSRARPRVCRQYAQVKIQMSRLKWSWGAKIKFKIRSRSSGGMNHGAQCTSTRAMNHRDARRGGHGLHWIVIRLAWLHRPRQREWHHKNTDLWQADQVLT